MSTSTMTRNFQRKAAAPHQRPVTPGQTAFLVDLVKQIGAYDAERGTELWLEMRARHTQGMTVGEASAAIDALKDERGALRLAQQVDPAEDRGTPRPARPQVPAGRYAVDTDEGHLGFYQVKVADNGFITVSVQASSELHELPWTAARGVLVKIEADPHAAAIRYGKELGVCGVCARPLTNEESRAAGIGPKCAQRF
jgi:hypothetical protein